MKCENCEEEKHIVDITNFTFEVKETISFNCCCKECAEDKIRKEGYEEYDIIDY